MTEPFLPAGPGTVLVTGAARRIGRAIALDLGRRGWAVAVHYNRSRDEAHEVAAEITASGARAAPVHADLAIEAQSQGLIAQATTALGPLTCLINNASVFERDTVDTLSHESWSRHLDINLRAPLMLAQAFAAQLPRDSSGNVINLLDQTVWRLTPTYMSYTASKSALWTLTRTLAMALAPRIRVNGIGPGPALPSAHQTAAAFAAQWAATPLGIGTTPEEICDAVRFLLSAPAMTGQMIALDGGQHLLGSTNEG